MKSSIHVLPSEKNSMHDSLEKFKKKKRMFNHAYDIGFQLNSEIEDPFKVPASKILTALLQRVTDFMKDLGTKNESELYEAIDCFDTEEFEEEIK